MALLPWLQTFLAVYRAGSITAAASRVYLTQPAVSQHIKALEARLGYRLFDRLPRGIAPTPAAHELVRLVAPHLDALEVAAESMQVAPGRLAGTVRLGGPAEFLGERVLPALTPVVDQGIRIEVSLGLADELLDQLSGGVLDLAVSTRSARRSGLESEALHKEKFVLVAGPTWASRVSDEAIATGGAKALDGVPLVSYDAELPILRRYWRVVFGVRLARKAAVIVPDLRAVRELVVAGAGVSVLPRYLCETALTRSRLGVLHRPERVPENTIHLAWRTGTAQDPRLAYVRALLRHTAERWASRAE